MILLRETNLSLEKASFVEKKEQSKEQLKSSTHQRVRKVEQVSLNTNELQQKHAIYKFKIYFK